MQTEEDPRNEAQGQVGGSEGLRWNLKLVGTMHGTKQTKQLLGYSCRDDGDPRPMEMLGALSTRAECKRSFQPRGLAGPETVISLHHSVKHEFVGRRKGHSMDGYVQFPP